MRPNQVPLDPSLTLRPATWTDLEGVTQLILDVCTADGDPTIAVTSEELAREWKSEDFRLETDAWVVQTSQQPDRRLRKIINRHAHAKYSGDGYVHPDYLGRGIGTAMLQALDERALEEMKLAEPDLRVYIRNGLAIGDTYGREMHEAQGYHTIRFSWRMEINLTEAPPAPVWPKGVELRPIRPGRPRPGRLRSSQEEAFSDHWGHARHLCRLAEPLRSRRLQTVPVVHRLARSQAIRCAAIAWALAGSALWKSAARGASTDWAWPCCCTPSASSTNAA